MLSKNLVVKIADFGAVSLLQETGCSNGSLHIVPSKQQTWPYLAPELLNNPEMERTRAMDVYSYAMIGYKIITRNQVFMSTEVVNPNLILQLIIENDQKPDIRFIDDVKTTLNTDCDRDVCCLLESIVAECWQTNPKERPSIQSVRDKLKAFSKPSDYRLFETKSLKKRISCSFSEKILLCELEFFSVATSTVAAGLQSTTKNHVTLSAFNQKNGNQVKFYYKLNSFSL